MNRQEIRLAGSGGQGVILATVIIAEAAVLNGQHTAQSQSYGPEARGGSCKAEVIVSDELIGFTKVVKPTFLMALTQQALDKYIDTLPADGLLLIDDTLTAPEGHRTVALPILRTAKEEVGKALTANIVAVGCINELLKLAPADIMRQAVLLHVPRGTEQLNSKAFEAGIKLASGAAQETAAPKASKAKKA